MFWFVIVCVLIYLIASYAIFRLAFGRAKELNWKSSEALEKTSWSPFAQTIPGHFTWLCDHGAQNISIQSHDGLTLHGVWIPQENPKATIILVHGYRGHYVSDFGEVLSLYHNLGFQILTFRQRAHGQSQGKYTTFGVLESRDLLAWIDYHNQTFGAMPIIVSGISMGASTVLYAAGKGFPKNVRGITADSGFTSPWEIVSQVMKDVTHLNLDFLLPGIDLWCRLLGKFSMKQCHTQTLLSRATVPALFIHGKADSLVPWEMSRRSFQAYGAEKTLITVAGAEHGKSYLMDKPRVEAALADFFRQCL